MDLRAILLASVAVCSFAAAPAIARSAGPSIHLAAHGMPMKTHFKATPHETVSNITETATFSANISISSYYKQKIVLLGETWYDSSNCTQPTKQKWTGLPKKTLYAKVSHSTSTGTASGCSGTTFTFQDIDYELTSKKAKSGDTDSVSGNLVAKNFDGYNLTLVAHVDITLAP